MAKAKLNWKVYITLYNYKGEVNEEHLVASFCSKQRATDYLVHMMEKHDEMNTGYRMEGDE